MKQYKSDIVLGERYRDNQTGYEGVATSASFFQHACERICLEAYDAERHEVKEMVFDAPRLIHIESGVQAVAARPGGDHRVNSQRGSNAR
jgi:hypothetical protein